MVYGFAIISRLWTMGYQPSAISYDLFAMDYEPWTIPLFSLSLLLQKMIACLSKKKKF